MKFEEHRTTGRSGPRPAVAAVGPASRVRLAAAGAGGERFEPLDSTLRARSRTYLQPLGVTIDRALRG